MRKWSRQPYTACHTIAARPLACCWWAPLAMVQLERLVQSAK